MHKRKRGRPPSSSSSNDVGAKESRKIRSALRNDDPRQIDTHGFAECAQLVDPALCAKIVKMPMRDAETISNALQKTLKGALLKRVCASIGSSSNVADAVEATFGVRTFAVRTVKVLMAEAASPAQIPHADDFCNRELFGIAHLLPDQARTECVPYDHRANYPTNVSVECDACGQWVGLPDRTARRREHEQRAFYCAHAGKQCLGAADAGANRAKWANWSIERDMVDATTLAVAGGGAAAAAAADAADAPRFTDASDVNAAIAASEDFDPFAHEVCTAFSPLLHDPAGVIAGMRPMGPPPRAGDGLVALPTLVHRGPGGDPALSGGPSRGRRWVLFFTIVPTFPSEGEEVDDAFETTLGEYDPEAQIHAVWLLWRAAGAVREPAKVVAAYRECGFDLDAFGPPN